MRIDLLSPFDYESDIANPALDIRPELAVAPSGPGLGVKLDEQAVAEWRETP